MKFTRKIKIIYFSYLQILICLFLIANLLIVPLYSRTEEKKEIPVEKEYKGKMEEMKLALDKGDFNEVIRIFQYEVGETKEFKNESADLRAGIYELLVKAYFLSHDLKNWDLYLRKWLRIKPNEKLENFFWRPIVNHAESTYRVNRRFLLGFKLALNGAMPEVGSRFTIFSPIDVTRPDLYRKNYQPFTIHVGQIGAVLEYPLTPSISIKICPTFTMLRYKYDCEYTWGDNDSADNTTATFSHIQKINTLEIPLLLKKCFWFSKKHQFGCYIQGGGFLRYKISAYKKIAVNITSSGYSDEARMENIKITGLIMKFQGGIQLGAGLEVVLSKKLQIQGELNYNRTLSRNMINEKNRYNYPEIEYGYYDLLDDVRLHNFSLSVNILMPLGPYKIFRR